MVYIKIASEVDLFNTGGGGPALEAATESRRRPPPPKHLDIFKGAPRRLPKPLSDQFPVRMCVCPVCIKIVCDCGCCVSHSDRVCKASYKPTSR